MLGWLDSQRRHGGRWLVPKVWTGDRRCWRGRESWDVPKFVAHTMSLKHMAIAVSDRDVVWMENLEFFFVKDGNVTTVTGLAHGE